MYMYVDPSIFETRPVGGKDPEIIMGHRCLMTDHSWMTCGQNKRCRYSQPIMSIHVLTYLQNDQLAYYVTTDI